MEANAEILKVQFGEKVLDIDQNEAIRLLHAEEELSKLQDEILGLAKDENQSVFQFLEDLRNQKNNQHPVYRPLIGMDKEEIVRTSREIDCFETSILPYEDCCTVFTPRHPKLNPTLEEVLEEEAKLNLAELEDEAYAEIEFFRVNR